MYNNNIAPYSAPPTIAQNPLVFDKLEKWDPLAKLFLVDTYHDLAQARDGYDPTHFIGTIIPNIIDFKDTTQQPPKKVTPPTGHYRGTIEKMFGKDVLVSNLEPTMNAYIENKYGLQPADAKVTFGDILDHPLKFNQDFVDTVSNSNGSIKISVPSPYTSFTHFLTQFTDPQKYLDAQKGIARFIKNYLYQDIKDTSKDVKDIRFLFDAGANQIGKIFRYHGSGGIRYNAMACTADSACSSDEGMDPSVPKKYENLGPNESVKVSSNFFSSEKYDMHFIVNDKSRFGDNGTKCFSVNFTNKGESPTDPTSAARYFFGARKNNEYGETDPCGSEGGSVSRIGTVMEELESIKGGFTKTPRATREEQKHILNSVMSGHCIPVGDSRFLKLFGPAGLQNADDIDGIEKLLADYKRTGDYEQSLTLSRAVKREKGNSNNYTFSSVDLLSTLFARLNGLPAVYQVGTNGTITLYRNDSSRGTPEDIEKAIKMAHFNRASILQSQRLKMFNELRAILNQPDLKPLLDQLEDAQYDDVNTRIQVDGILFVFGKVRNIIDRISPDIELHPTEQEKVLNELAGIYRFIECQKSFKSILNKDLEIKILDDVNNFALPWLDFSVRKSKTKTSEKIDKLIVEEMANNAKISKYDRIYKPVGPGENPPARDKLYYEKQKETQSKIINEKQILIASITFGPAQFGEIEGGGRKKKKGGTKKKHKNFYTKGNSVHNVTKNKHTHKNKKTVTKDINRTIIKYEILEREVVEIVRNVFNSSNTYLKDLYGLESGQNELPSVRTAWAAPRTKSPGPPTRKRGRSASRSPSGSASRSPSGQGTRKKKKFELAYFTTHILADYSDDVAVFLSSMFADFMSSLEGLILVYNYDFEPTSIRLTMKDIFVKYDILTYILVLCCLNTTDSSMTTRYEGNNYTLNALINKDIETLILGNMKGVVGAEGIALSIFALSGCYMGNYTLKDYCVQNAKMELAETRNLLITKNLDRAEIILYKNEVAITNAITLMSREGVTHPLPFGHNTRRG